MENERVENDVPGGVPEFGAIFMSNIATKRECFKRKVFALPSSMGNFVKQVKEGMVLFLFEFEKRQLFGVYRATSDGAMNILPHAFNSSGKQFPAQVCFTPIWICHPLYENEFRDAIRENYFSAKKFSFGLSEDQVRHLLELFSTRKVKGFLPPRQFSRIVNRPAGKDRRQFDHGTFAIRDRLEMEHGEYDFTPTDMTEFLEHTPDRAVEADEDMLFIDDRVEYENKTNNSGNYFLTDQVGDSQRKRQRVYDGMAETELHNTSTSLLSYRTDYQEISLDKETIPAAHGWFLMPENTDDSNTYATTAIATEHNGGPFELTRRKDYERPLLEVPKIRGIDHDRFQLNDAMGNKLNLHNSFRTVKSNEHEEDFHRPGRATVVPSENFDNSFHRVKRTYGDSKLLMGEKIVSEHDFDNGLRLDSLSEKFGNPFDSDQRTIDGRRFLLKDKVMKANYMDGAHGLTASYLPSRYDISEKGQVAVDCLLSKNNRVDDRQDNETFLRPVSAKYTAFSHLKQNSSDCFSKPYPDTQYSHVKGSKNLKTLNSTFHDSIVTRTVPSAPELPTFHRGLSLSVGVDQGASLALDTHYGSGRDLLSLSKSKSFELEGSGRYDPAPDVENKDFFPTNNDFSHGRAAEIPRDMELKSSAPADDRSLQFPSSSFASVPFTESCDLCSWKRSPLASDSCSVLSQGVQKHIPLRANDERFARNEVLSFTSNLTGFDTYHQEKRFTNDDVECYKSYETDYANDSSQLCLKARDVYPDFAKQRRSVFTRLTSTPRVRILEEKEREARFDLDTSVDDIMDMLNSSQKFWMKTLRKFKPVAIQDNREELARNEKHISPEWVRPTLAPTKSQDEVSQAVEEGADDMPKETRAVEFKRRSEQKKDLDETNTTINVLGKEDNTFRENAEPGAPVNKQQKRRKLVRPVFSDNVSVDGVTGNQNLLSQSQPLTNKI